MIEAPAEVLRVDGGSAWVRVSGNQGGCGRCDEPGGCRSPSLMRALGGRTAEFRVPNVIDARPGDRVHLRMAEGAPLRAALASYGLATLLMLAGALAAVALVDVASVDLRAAAGAGAGLLAAWMVNRVLGRSRGWRRGLSVEMTAALACRPGGVERE